MDTNTLTVSVDNNDINTFTSYDSTASPPNLLNLVYKQEPTYPKLIWDELDNMFNTFWKNFPSPLVVEDTKYPKCNAYSDNDGLHIDLALPYIKKDDLDINVDTKLRKLTIKGKAHQDKDDGKKKYYKREISRTSFQRVFLIGGE